MNYVIDGEEKTTAFYTELEALTPHCVMSKVPSDYFVSCVEDSILLVSDAEVSEEVNRKFPKFNVMCRMLSEELLAKERLDFEKNFWTTHSRTSTEKLTKNTP